MATVDRDDQGDFKHADIAHDTLINPAHSHQLHRQRPSLLVRLAWRAEDTITGINWKHVAYKTVAFTYLIFMLSGAWWVLPMAGHWPDFVRDQSDKVPIVYQDFFNYFGRFEGFAECGIRARDLYQLPPRDEHGHFEAGTFCPNRPTLLRAMSNGGRVGYDAPYQPQGCAYRWYSIDEICFILERFDALAFLGDTSLQPIYNGFNILLRQDLAAGSLKTWEMDQAARDQCHCNSQIINPSCSKYFVTSSEEVVDNTPTSGSAYHCKRTPHGLLVIDSSPASPEIISKFKALVPQAPRSKYKPIPIIHSLSPHSVSQQVANQSLLEILGHADDSKRKTPMLWIGPAAPGHVEVANRKSKAEIWTYDHDMAKAATHHDIEMLKMFNMTTQATSYDGITFSEGVAITQAMMVVNWLSRLESS